MKLVLPYNLHSVRLTPISYYAHMIRWCVDNLEVGVTRTVTQSQLFCRIFGHYVGLRTCVDHSTSGSSLIVMSTYCVSCSFGFSDCFTMSSNSTIKPNFIVSDPCPNYPSLSFFCHSIEPRSLSSNHLT